MNIMSERSADNASGAARSRRLRRGATAIAGAGLLVWSSAASAATGGYADLVERVAPAVVNIFTTQPAPKTATGPSPFAPGGAFEDFARRFGIPMPPTGPTDEAPARPASALGSGFVVDPDGYVVTNNHVIDGASEIRVKMADQREYPATVVGTDPDTDLALLKVSAPEPLPSVAFGDSAALRVGDPVIAVGNPFGLGGTVTSGIVSARARSIDGGAYVDFIQTDAAINRGSSGGPLFDTEGRVVGVNSAILSPNGGSVGVGFAIPSDTARTVVAQLKSDGRVDRGWLGVSVQPVTPEIAQAMGLDGEKGALIADVMANGPAYGQLRAGDVVRAVDGLPVETVRDLPKLIAASEIGRRARLGVVRNGEMIEVPVQIGHRKPRLASVAPAEQTRPDSAALGRLGVTVAAVTDEVRASLRLEPEVDGAVVTSVKPDGAAAGAGIAAGDVIQKLGDRPIRTPGDLAEAVRETRSPSVLALINRRGNTLFVGVRLADA